MSQTRKLTVDRIIEIGEAVAMIGDNRYLEGTTAYKVGMLGDYCKPFIKNFVKERNKIVQEAKRKQKAIIDPVKDQATSDAKAKANEDVAQLMQEMQERLNDLSTTEEDVKIPQLKLSEFIAKADITDVFVKDGIPETKVVVKSGHTLVPTKFFTLMGDIIIDDKNTDG